LVWTSQPSSPGRTTVAPPGESSTANSSAGEMTVTADDADVRVSSSSDRASAAVAAPSSSSRSSTWIGTPSVPPSSEHERKFSPQPTPRLFTPSLARMPASVAVVNQRPSGATTDQSTRAAARSGCQSHVCASDMAVPPATTEHSPRPQPASSSVRALIAASSRTSSPAPAATPSSSSSRAGQRAASCAATASPCASTSARVTPTASARRRRYVVTVTSIASAQAAPNTRPRSPGAASREM
jgi:hypothetical protein